MNIVDENHRKSFPLTVGGGYSPHTEQRYCPHTIIQAAHVRDLLGLVASEKSTENKFGCIRNLSVDEKP